MMPGVGVEEDRLGGSSNGGKEGEKKCNNLIHLLHTIPYPIHLHSEQEQRDIQYAASR